MRTLSQMAIISAICISCTSTNAALNPHNIPHQPLILAACPDGYEACEDGIAPDGCCFLGAEHQSDKSSERMG